MKKMTFALLAALAFVVVAVGIPHPQSAHAGLLAVAPQGSGGGNTQADRTNGQRIDETYDRGISWAAPVAYSVVTATSGAAPFSVTETAGYASTYKGSWYIRFYNTGPTTGVFTPLTFSAAYTANLTAIGTLLSASSGAVNGIVTVGPLANPDFGHLRGQTATATGFYQLGSYNR